jgi:hypothetical protein
MRWVLCLVAAVLPAGDWDGDTSSRMNALDAHAQSAACFTLRSVKRSGSAVDSVL